MTRKTKWHPFVFALAASLFWAANGLGQTATVEFPQASPTATIKQRVGFTDIEITYSRPGIRGRKVFGGLVPNDQVWRTGANASTRISFSTPVKLNGVEIPAGKYALYTIPNPNEWTVIIYKDTSLEAANGYQKEDDQARIRVKPTHLIQPVETFTIDIGDLHDDSGNLNLTWENTKVTVRVETEVVGVLLPKIKTAMSSTDKKTVALYNQAAAFYLEHGQDLKQALEWVDTGLADKPANAYALLHLKAKILAKLGDKPAAIMTAQESIAAATKAGEAASPYLKLNTDLISSLH